jgi:hypothetical protein
MNRQVNPDHCYETDDGVMYMPKFKDPSHEEMLNFLTIQCAGEEDIRFDIEEAIYWFANDWHGGQWSNLYAALCTSQYTPGPAMRKPPDPFMYDMLVAEFTTAPDLTRKELQ